MKKKKTGRRIKRMMNEERRASEPEILDAQVVEDTAAEQTEATAAPEENAVDVAKLQADLEAATAQADEYLKLAQRTKADFENFRRRNESVRADSFADGQRSVATAMLPVLDALDENHLQY